MRVRPGDAGWPSEEAWHSLGNVVGNRLIKLDDPLAACRENPDSQACQALLKEIRNPYFVSENPALTETSGWLDAWTSLPSTYAIKVRTTDDVVAAVNFARENNLQLVVKGGGHSYQGTSESANSLMIWTREMNAITMHDAFVPRGCDATHAPQPAVTVETGARWYPIYEEVTTRGGRYVQGGGCATVGVAGFIHGGGFGSFSKNFGQGAAALLPTYDHLLPATGARRFSATTQAGTRLFRRNAGRLRGMCNDLPDTQRTPGVTPRIREVMMSSSTTKTPTIGFDKFWDKQGTDNKLAAAGKILNFPNHDSKYSKADVTQLVLAFLADLVKAATADEWLAARGHPSGSV